MRRYLIFTVLIFLLISSSSLQSQNKIIGESVNGSKGEYKSLISGSNITIDQSIPGQVKISASDPVRRGRVGYFACPSATGNYSVTGLGFKPKVIEFIGHKNDGMQTWFFHSQGFADDVGNQNVSTLAGNFSNLFLGDCKFDRCIYLINTARNIQVMATLISMDDDGFTLNFTYVNSIFVVRWMAF